MAAFMQESLVLRGIVVRQDALAVELRLGTSVEANPRAPGNRNSLRHPLPAKPGADADGVDYPTSGATPGAGRSRRQPGQPASWRRPALTLGSKDC